MVLTKTWRAWSILVWNSLSAAFISCREVSSALLSLSWCAASSTVLGSSICHVKLFVETRSRGNRWFSWDQWSNPLLRERERRKYHTVGSRSEIEGSVAVTFALCRNLSACHRDRHPVLVGANRAGRAANPEIDNGSSSWRNLDSTDKRKQRWLARSRVERHF